MLRLIRVFCLLLLVLIALSAPIRARAQNDCLPTRLKLFDAAVLVDRPLALDPRNLRAAPALNAQAIGDLSIGKVANVLDGSRCVDRLLWREVVFNGVRGWTLEATPTTYILAVYAPPAPERVSPPPADPMAPPPAVQAGPVDRYGVRFDRWWNLVVYSQSGGVDFEPRIGYTLPGSMSPRPNAARFTFTDYVFKRGQEQAHITVYPVAGFLPIGDYFAPTFAELRRILAERPDLSAIPGDLIDLPRGGAAQIFHAAERYLNFEGGSGYRFIAYYAQNTVEITPERRFEYHFVGLTDDGKYLIRAVFPIRLPDPAAAPELYPFYDEQKALDGLGSEGPRNSYYRDYVAQFVANLNALPSALIFPDPAALIDPVIESLRVTDDVMLAIP